MSRGPKLNRDWIGLRVELEPTVQNRPFLTPAFFAEREAILARRNTPGATAPPTAGVRVAPQQTPNKTGFLGTSSDRLVE